MELLPALARATSDFDRLVAGVGDEAWSAPSPCTAWDVRAVVNHVVAGNIMATRLLDGAATADAVSGLLDADLLGDAPEDAVRRTGAEQLAAFTRPGAADMTVHHPAGDLARSSRWCVKRRCCGWATCSSTVGTSRAAAGSRSTSTRKPLRRCGKPRTS